MPVHWYFLVSAPTAGVEDIVDTLKTAEAGINERHILWFVFGGDSAVTNHVEPMPFIASGAG